MELISTARLLCRDSAGLQICELTLADAAGKSSIELQRDGRIKSVAELADYLIMLRPLVEEQLALAPPVTPAPVQASAEVLGALKSQGGLGIVRLSVINAQQKVLWQHAISIRPEKFGEDAEFERMVSDLCSARTSLALNLHAFTSAPWALGERRTDFQPDELIAVVRAGVTRNDFFRSLETIEQRARVRLDRNDEMAHLGRERMDPARFGRYLGAPGERAVVPPSHYLASRVTTLPIKSPSARKIETTNAPENQFAKLVAVQIKGLLDEATRRLDAYVESEAVRWAALTAVQLRNTLARPFFKSLTLPSHVPLGSPAMQRRPEYRAVLKAFLDVRAGLALSWPELSQIVFAETRDVATLYEYWCLAQMCDTVNGLYGSSLAFSDFLAAGEVLSLRRGSHSRSSVPIMIDGVPHSIELHYNRTFPPTLSTMHGAVRVHQSGVGTWSKPMKPDYTIALKNALGAAERFVHFDAKYKVKSVESLADEKTYHGSDLDKMHAYAAGIYNTAGAYIIYPGSVTRQFESASGARVGAIGSIPGKDTGFAETLKLTIDDVVKD